MIDNSKYIVFFGGAGVSTESGIKDFRSADGLYNQKFEKPAEYYLSIDCFNNNPKEFWDFYIQNMNVLDAKPNIIHNYLANLEAKGKLKAIITQNIDNLHQKAGSKNVLELHGSIYRNYCLNCHKQYDVNKIFSNKTVPNCSCGGLIKPDVVLYGEMLDDSFDKAINYISKADLLIVAGTSLTVWPAAGLINYFNGDNLVIINKDITSYDYNANLVINDNIKNVIEKLK